MKKKLILAWLILVLIAPIASYFRYDSFIYPDGLYFLTIIYFVLTFIFWRKLPFTGFRKILFVGAGFLVGIVLSVSFIVLTMFLPGSKEHNYVMYKICLPEIRRYYKMKEGDPLQKNGEPVDEKGFGRWWYQHVECENNVYDGKGPIFSDNPSDFHPISNQK